MEQLVLEEPNKLTWKSELQSVKLASTSCVTAQMFDRPLLEKLEAGTFDHSDIAKVDIIHLNLSGAENPVDHHSVEPHRSG